MSAKEPVRNPQVPGDVASMAADIRPVALQNVPQATELVQIAESRYRFAADMTGGVFAVEHNGPNLAHPLKGHHGLRQQLAAAYFTTYGRAPSSNALTDAVSVIEGRALNSTREQIELRIAPHGKGVVLDLGTADGRCVIVTPTGWRVSERSPVVFRRTELTNPLPDPIPGGSIDALRDVLNVTVGSWQALVAWLTASLIPNLPHPVLLLTGEQGTGKTTAARMIAELIDPSGAPLIAPPDRIERWFEAANGSWVIGIDNLSSISDWLSDALCRAVTGDALRKRTLYADMGTTIVQFRRCVILTGIGVTATRGDLAERLLTVELHRIDSGRRQPESELLSLYRAAHPQVLGALLDLLVQVLAARSDLRLENLPRMADYAQILAAIDSVTGWNTLPAYLQAGSDIASEMVANDPVGAAVMSLIEDVNDWQGTPTELLAALNERRGETRQLRGWPNQPNRLSQMLNRVAPALRDLGINAELTRTSRSRIWQIQAISGCSDKPSLPSPPSPLRQILGVATSDRSGGPVTEPAGVMSSTESSQAQPPLAIWLTDDDHDGNLIAKSGTHRTCGACGDVLLTPDQNSFNCPRCAT